MVHCVLLLPKVKVPICGEVEMRELSEWEVHPWVKQAMINCNENADT